MARHSPGLVIHVHRDRLEGMQSTGSLPDPQHLISGTSPATLAAALHSLCDLLSSQIV